MHAVEYQAKREWLRLNPRGMKAQVVRRELRAWERELVRQGATVEAWMESTRTLRLSPWYVLFWPDRPGQPRESKVVHKDRYCQFLAGAGDKYIREATDDEVERLPPCGRCAS